MFLWTAGCVVATMALCSSCALEEVNQAYFDQLNGMFEKSYSEISLQITNGVDEETKLTDKFTVRYGENSATISYSVEEFLPLSVESTSALKKTTSGTVLLEDGVVTQIDGETAELPYEELSSVGLNFEKDYFTKIEATNFSFSASVTDPAGFFGTENFSGKDMTIYAVFTDVYQTIFLSYTASDGTSVSCSYSFKQ